MNQIDMLKSEHCGLLIVDIQDRMMRVISGRDEVVGNTVLMMKTANVLKIPMVATTQYVKRIGEFLPGITAELGEVTPVDKLEFGCFENEAVLAALKSHKEVDTWICCGVETHICMYQTVLGGIREGYRMWIPADAVSSRTEKNYLTGLDRIRQIGGVVASTELIIYELLHKAGTPEFKSILPFLK